MSVVKADGYGHGAVNVAKALSEAGADLFGVANFAEALELHDQASLTNGIVILSGGDPNKIPEIVHHRFVPVIYDPATLRRFNEEGKRAGIVVKVHIKFDTSMGRLGFFPDDAAMIFKELRRLENIQVDGIMSHFSFADDDPGYSRKQLDTFNTILQTAKELDIDPPFKHIANSAGIINLPESHYNLVRPGIMLFGCAPSMKMRNKAPLKPVMSIHSRIIQIKEFPAGAKISYSGAFTTKRISAIAVIPIGYADGYSRLLSNKGHVLLRGKRAPVTGNVTMDMTMVDVTDMPGAKVGDYVTVLGEAKDGGSISAWDIARLSDTISYEILTSFSKRVARIAHG